MDAQATATEVRPEGNGKDGSSNGATPGLHGPDSALASRLAAVAERVPPPEIADVWLFPPLPEVDSSSDFVLFTRILDEETRALFSAGIVPANGRPAHQVIVEHGSAPADRVPRLVANLQRRLGGTAPARHVVIEGCPDRWRELLEKARGNGDGTASD